MFSSILKTLRTEKEVSQTQLAKEIGVSAGNIGDWEIGRSKPGYVALAALARFFEVSADYLLELSPEKTSEPPTELRGLDEIKASQGLTCDGLPLSEDEVDLVAMYRLLPPSHLLQVQAPRRGEKRIYLLDIFRRERGRKKRPRWEP